jgi:hypothetical protein
MLFDRDMKEANTNDTWMSIGLAAALVLNRLQTQRQLSDAENPSPGHQQEHEKQSENHGSEQDQKTQRAKLANFR